MSVMSYHDLFFVVPTKLKIVPHVFAGTAHQNGAPEPCTGATRPLGHNFKVKKVFCFKLDGMPEGSSALKKFKVGQNFEKFKVGLKFQNYFQSPFSEFFSKLGSEKAMRGTGGGSGSGFLGWGAGFFCGVPRVFTDALDR